MSAEPEGTVRITLRDVYEVAVRTEGAVARLMERDEAREKRAEDHETRLRDLEKKVWALPSLATLIALGSFVVNIVQK